jgi:hypothetical protein
LAVAGAMVKVVARAMAVVVAVMTVAVAEAAVVGCR